MREKEGCFQVPVVHSTVLVDLRKGVGPGEGLVDQLAYWPPAEGFTGPVDDILHFAFSAKTLGIASQTVTCSNAVMLWCFQV